MGICKTEVNSNSSGLQNVGPRRDAVMFLELVYVLLEYADSQILEMY